MAVRALLWSLVLVGCLALVVTQQPPPVPGVCPPRDAIPELCSMFSCQPIDCISNNQRCCPINCNGVPAGFRCADPDADECAIGTANNCSVNAACTNELGTFSCACNPGFTGDGVTCLDVDECAQGTDNCNLFAACANVQGSYSCTCFPGFTGDGVTCLGLNACATGASCATNAVCTSIPGSFDCTCVPGFVGDGFSFCVDEDECTSRPCHPNAFCTNTPGSFDCTCNPGYVGDGIAFCFFIGTTTSTTSSPVTTSRRPPTRTPTTTFPPLTCANVLCAGRYPTCCLRSVQCVTFPCPRLPECVEDPCRYDPCNSFGTCIRECNLCERCECISRNPCDTVRCAYGSVCDPRTGQCIPIDICKTQACPRGSVCDPTTGSCINICHSVGSRDVGRSKPGCVCEAQEVCLGQGYHGDDTGSCCRPMSLPTTSAAVTPTAVILPWLFLAIIAYLKN